MAVRIKNKITLRRGQFIVGYVVLLAIVIAALMVIGSYVRNAMSGKIRQGGDALGSGGQYDPGPGYGPFNAGGKTVNDKNVQQ